MNDLISRNALLEWVKNQKAEATGVYGNIIAASIDAVMRHNVANAIRSAPAVDAEPVRRGEWVGNSVDFACSVCGAYQNMYTGKTNYCPNCGAKMDLK